jgi:hypothetical protein
MISDNTLPTTNMVDRHSRRLLRDLTAIGLVEAGNCLSADERLTDTLSHPLLQALRTELDRLDSSPLLPRSRHLRVA